MRAEDPLSELFSALANPIRRAILSRLAVEALTPQEIAIALDLTPRAVLTEVGMLEAAGLLELVPRGGIDALRLRSDRILLLETWLSWFRRFRIESFDGLQSCIDDIVAPTPDDAGTD